MFSFVLSECSDGPAYYNFLGDSIVELWDLNDNFPTLLTKNYGVAGSGIEYIRENAGCFDNQNLIILFGTNDLNAAYSDQDIENYVTQYLDAVTATRANPIYLISVLPRITESNVEAANEVIDKFNACVKRRIVEENIDEIIYVDVHDLLLKDGCLNLQYSYDGLHLNRYGYEILTDQLNKYLLK
ncbi:MAG: hypothetical protein J6C81_02610 [Muribaculaceae bacterium]|nr:hypothetical protein [Muribaculaceae bacterium]